MADAEGVVLGPRTILPMGYAFDGCWPAECGDLYIFLQLGIMWVRGGIFTLMRVAKRDKGTSTRKTSSQISDGDSGPFNRSNLRR